MNPKHVLVLSLSVASVLVGGLSIVPHLLARQALGDSYQGIPLFYTDNEDYYIARSQEVLDGHPEVGSPYYFEYKGSVAVQPPLSERLHAALSQMIGIPLIMVFLIAKFMLPAVLFCLVAWLAICLVKDELPHVQILVGITAGLGATIGYDALSPSQILAVLGNQDIGLHLSLWTRPINPISGGIFLFATLLMLWSLWKNKNVGVAIFAGIVLGFSNSYFFSWGLGMSITGLLFLASLPMRDARRSLCFLMVLGISLLLNALMLLGFIGNPEGQTLALRNGLLLMREPLFNKVLLAALAVFAATSYGMVRQGMKPRELIKQPWWIFSLCILLGSLAALNQQILTGKAIWPYHFVQYTKPLAFVVVLAAVTAVARGRFRKPWHIACAALSIFFVFQSAVAASTYRAYENDFRTRQSWAPVFSWLKETPKESVVLALGPKSEALSIWIPAFTSNNVYISPYSMSGVPIERVEHNLFVEMRLEGVTTGTTQTWLIEHDQDIRTLFYRDWFDTFRRRDDQAWLDALRRDLAGKYAEFVLKDFRTELPKYRIDYLVTDEAYTSATLVELTLEEVARMNGFKIYRFLP